MSIIKIASGLYARSLWKKSRLLSLPLILTLVILLAGCGQNSDSHTVAGVVQSPTRLSGHLVEVTLASDSKQRGFGSIDTEGKFRLERLVEGATQPGLPAGKYLGRLILNDEGDGQTKKPRIPAKYLDFKKSGWSIEVPSRGEWVLNVTAK